MHKTIVLLSALCFVAASTFGADRAEKRWEFDNGALQVHANPRTPQQIAAFYIGRKFPPEMIELLRQECFVTFVIRNRSAHVIWLDQSRWTFEAGGEALQSLDRTYWKQQWQELDAPLAAQSTFRWTLLPETLDFRPNETEGGNVVLPRTDKPITLTARFAREGTAANDTIEVRFDDLRCAQDAPR